MNEKERIVNENINEYMGFAEIALSSHKYNSAVTLFFKAISAATDLFILKKEGRIPASHSSKFSILRQKYPDIYDLLDKDFPFYQDSYTKKMNKEAAIILKEDAAKIKKLSQDLEEQ